MEKRRLTEWLLIAGIILIVLATSGILVSSARSKTRDVTRLAHVRLIQSALEDYFNEHNQYPLASELPLGDTTQSSCLGMEGFQGECRRDTQLFLRFVPPTFDQGLSGLVTCGTPKRNALCYSTDADGQAYQVLFEIENTMNALRLTKGLICATQNGISSGVCE